MGPIQEFKLKDYATLLGTFVGFVDIVLSIFLKSYHLAAFFIFLAIIADLLDGFVARKTKTGNEFGKELDSLSDGICFGVAPAILVFMMYTEPITRNKMPGWNMWIMIFPTFIFIAGAITRLAWFNISKNEGYTGLPTPITAGFVAMSVIVDIVSYELTKTMSPSANGFNVFMHYAIPFLMIFLAYCNVTDKIAYGKSIRKKSGGLKYFLLTVFVLVIVTFITTLFDFSGREIVIVTLLIILWAMLIGFIAWGFVNAKKMRQETPITEQKTE